MRSASVASKIMKKVDYSNTKISDLIGTGKVDLLEPTGHYNVSKYNWAYQAWKKHQQAHWIGEEIPMSEDIKSWAIDLEVEERNLLIHLFRFFVQSDVEVSDNYFKSYVNLFKPLPIQMMMAAFTNMETIHYDSYALILTTLGMPDTEFSAFKEYREMQDKVDYMHSFPLETCADVSRNIAMFAAFTEGLMLFSSFVMLLNFSRFGAMKGMSKIVDLSLKDENAHCEGMMQLFHEWNKQTGSLTKEVKKDIYEICKKMIELENKFIDLAFSCGKVRGMQAEDIKEYILYTADYRICQLGLKPFNGYFKKEKQEYKQIKPHPIAWAVSLVSGSSITNFFENKEINYSKGATTGNWGQVWEDFDKIKK